MITQCGRCGKEMIWMADTKARECPDYRKDKEHHGFIVPR